MILNVTVQGVKVRLAGNFYAVRNELIEQINRADPSHAHEWCRAQQAWRKRHDQILRYLREYKK